MKLTKNFELKEFASKDGAPFPDNVISNITTLAKNLQVLRDHLGKSIIINSGYRSPAHNKKIGGSPNSQHLLGKASDIRINGVTPKELHTIIEKLITEGKMQQGGLGLYNSFVHYDIRGTKARWVG